MPHLFKEIRCATFKFEAPNCVIRKIWVTEHLYLFSLFYLCRSIEIISSLIHLWYCGIYGCCSYLGLSFHMKHQEIVEGSSIIMFYVPVGFWISRYVLISFWNMFFFTIAPIFMQMRRNEVHQSVCIYQSTRCSCVFNWCIDNVGQSKWTRSYCKYYIAAISLIQSPCVCEPLS